jgi:tetratricopeptide (TPR) repeat protein
MQKMKHLNIRSIETSDYYFLKAEKKLEKGFRYDSKVEYRKALQYFTKAQHFSLIKQSVHDAKVAECFYYLDQETIARSYLKEALLIDPDCFEAYDVLSSLDWDDDNKRLSSYYEMIRIKPDYGFGYYMVGKLLEEQDKVDDALRIYYQSIQKSLLNADDQYILRWCIPRIVTLEASVKSIDFIEDHLLNPRLTVRTKNFMMHYLAYLYLETNEIDVALQKYNLIVESTKSSKLIIMISEYYLANLCIALVLEKYYQNYDEAIKYYKLIVEPKNTHCILPAYLGLRRCMIALNCTENLTDIENEMIHRCGKDIVKKFDYSVDHGYITSYLC